MKLLTYHSTQKYSKYVYKIIMLLTIMRLPYFIDEESKNLDEQIISNLKNKIRNELFKNAKNQYKFEKSKRLLSKIKEKTKKLANTLYSKRSFKDAVRIISLIDKKIVPTLLLCIEKDKVMQKVYKVYIDHFTKELLPHLEKFDIVNKQLVAVQHSEIYRIIKKPQNVIISLFGELIKFLHLKKQGSILLFGLKTETYLLKIYEDKTFEINENNILYWNEIIRAMEYEIDENNYQFKQIKQNLISWIDIYYFFKHCLVIGILNNKSNKIKQYYNINIKNINTLIASPNILENLNKITNDLHKSGELFSKINELHRKYSDYFKYSTSRIETLKSNLESIANMNINQ